MSIRIHFDKLTGYNLEESQRGQMVTIKVDNTHSLLETSNKDLREKIHTLLSYEVEGSVFAKRFSPYWDGRVKLLDKHNQFPTGLAPRVIGYLKKRGIAYKLEDLRPKPKPTYPFKIRLAPGFEPRYYQTAVAELTDTKPRGVNWIGTGGGKTLTSAMVIERRKVPALFVTPDTGLRNQAFNDFSQWFGEALVGTDVTGTKPIVVSNIQALVNKDPKYFNRFKLLIIDEFHHAAAKSYLKINKWCKEAYYRYGFTGTFTRADGADMTMHGVLSNTIFRKSTSELINEGFLVKPYITFYRIEAPKKEMARMNYKDAYDFFIRFEPFNRLVADLANLKIEETKQTLVLVRRKEAGRSLAEMIPDAIFLSGDDPQDYREKVKQSFIAKKIRCLIATDIFGEGQDIPSIDCLINARLQKTEIQTSQGIGRALRKAPGKDKAEVFDFLIIGQKHLQAHSVERILSLKKEPAFQIQIRRP